MRKWIFKKKEKKVEMEKCTSSVPKKVPLHNVEIDVKIDGIRKFIYPTLGLNLKVMVKTSPLYQNAINYNKE